MNKLPILAKLWILLIISLMVASIIYSYIGPDNPGLIAGHPHHNEIESVLSIFLFFVIVIGLIVTLIITRHKIYEKE